MDIRDLRIGNILKDDDGDLISINALSETGCIGYNKIGNDSAVNSCFSSFDCIRPLQINDAIIKRIGWKKDNSGGYKLSHGNFYAFLSNDSKKEYILSILKKDKIKDKNAEKAVVIAFKKIKYIHQLQNGLLEAGMKFKVKL